MSMPDFNYYCFEMPWGFITCDLNSDEPPALGEYTRSWAITEEKAQEIAEGAEVHIVEEGVLAVIPTEAPNNGIV